MTTSSSLRTVRRAVLCLCVALSFAAVAHAANPPKFSDPAVNDFVKKYDDLIDRMVKDLNSTDDTKLTKDSEEQLKMMAEMDKVKGKVKPAEADAWGKFLTGALDRLNKAVE